MATLDPIDLAYAAGIVDGEGYIGITSHDEKKRTNRSTVFQLVVNVGMADLEIPAWLHETFGGGLYSYPPRRVGTRGAHHWRLVGQDAVPFCRTLRPYLKLKHRQAQLVVDYASDPATQRVGRPLPAHITAARHEYAAIARDLNQRRL